MKRLVALVLCLILLLAGCAPAAKQEGLIELADLGTVDFHSSDQKTYLNGDYQTPGTAVRRN